MRLPDIRHPRRAVVKPIRLNIPRPASSGRQTVYVFCLTSGKQV